MTPPTPPRNPRGCRLLLVLSPERSGSTLLSVMLGAHSAVLAPPELHLLRFPTFDAWRSGYPLAFQSLANLWEMLELAGGEEEIRRTFGGRPTPDVYRWLLQRCPPGHVLVDKTPAYGRSPGSLERAEPLRPHYLWLVRHPLGVAASRLERREQERRRDRSALGRLKLLAHRLRGVVQDRSVAVEKEVRYWVEVHRRIGSFLSAVEPERWSRVRFEELVRDPRREMDRLAGWLGLGIEDSMLEPRKHAPSALQWGLGDGKLLAHPGIEPAVADRWRRTLDEGMLGAEARDLLERLETGRRGEGPAR